MAVRLRMKKMGRRHRPFFRVCAVDRRGSRDGRVIEYLGHYDPMVSETDARAVLQSGRIDYWLSVGAQPSNNVKVLIKKYGTHGTHLEQQRVALERLKLSKPQAPPPEPVPPLKKEKPAPEPPPAPEAAAPEAAAPEAAAPEAAAPEAAAPEAAAPEAAAPSETAPSETAPAAETASENETKETNE